MSFVCVFHGGVATVVGMSVVWRVVCGESRLPGFGNKTIRIFRPCIFILFPWKYC